MKEENMQEAYQATLRPNMPKKQTWTEWVKSFFVKKSLSDTPENFTWGAPSPSPFWTTNSPHNQLQ